MERTYGKRGMFGEKKENLTSAFSGIVLASISKHEKEVFRCYLVCSVDVDHFNQVQLLSSLISIGSLCGSMTMISFLSFLHFQ